MILWLLLLKYSKSNWAPLIGDQNTSLGSVPLRHLMLFDEDSSYVAASAYKYSHWPGCSDRRNHSILLAVRLLHIWHLRSSICHCCGWLFPSLRCVCQSLVYIASYLCTPTSVRMSLWYARAVRMCTCTMHTDFAFQLFFFYWWVSKSITCFLYSLLLFKITFTDNIQMYGATKKIPRHDLLSTSKHSFRFYLSVV